MARTGTKASKPRQRTILPEPVLSYCLNTIVNFRSRNVVLHSNEFEFSVDDVLAISCPPHVASILTDAGQYARRSANDFFIRLPEGLLKGVNSLRVHCRESAADNSPLLPHSPLWQGAGFSSNEPQERLLAYLRKVYEVSTRSAVIEYALTTAIKLSSSPAQFRYMFPAIIPLIQAGDKINPNAYGGLEAKQWMERYGEHCATSLPAMTPSERALMREAAALITAETITGLEHVTELTKQVIVVFSGVVDYFWGEQKIP